MSDWNTGIINEFRANDGERGLLPAAGQRVAAPALDAAIMDVTYTARFEHCCWQRSTTPPMCPSGSDESTMTCSQSRRDEA